MRRSRRLLTFGVALVSSLIAVLGLACGSFGTTPTAPDASTVDPEVETTQGQDASLVDAQPSPATKPGCIGKRVADSFERQALDPSPWTNFYNKNAPTKIELAEVGGNTSLRAQSDGTPGQSQAFYRSDIDGKHDVWDACLSFELSIEKAPATEVLGPRFLAWSVPQAEFVTGVFQGLNLLITSDGLVLGQYSNGSCPGNGCSPGRTPVSPPLGEGPHQVVLAIHATSEKVQGSFGYVDVGIDNVVLRVALGVALANQTNRELRFGIQTFGPAASIRYDDALFDAP